MPPRPRPSFRFLACLGFSPSLTFFLGLAFFASPASAQTTWTLRHQNNGAPQTGYLWGLVEGANGLVAVGENGRILHSADGRAWTRRDSGTTVWLTAVTYGAGRYIAVGDNGTILTSTDSVAWSRVANSGTTARLNNVAFGQNKFVAVGEANTIVGSSDGLVWIKRNFANGPSKPNRWFRALAASQGIWIAAGEAGLFAISRDGVSWAELSYPALGIDPDAYEVDFESATLTERLPAYLFPHEYYLLAGSKGATWTYDWGWAGQNLRGATAPLKPATTARFRSASNGNGLRIVNGEAGEIYSAPNNDGPWTKVLIATTKNLVGSGFALGSLYLVGENETIFQSEPIFPSRLGNVSTRGIAISGASAMIVGTVVRGMRPKRILIRGIGPALARFGIAGFLADPTLTVINGAGAIVASNSAWGRNPNPQEISDAAVSVGAFVLAGGSRDAALVLTLAPGSYTFHVASALGASGTALVEAYDLDALDATSSRAINLSTRGQVGTGDNILIAGLVVQGPSSRTVLIRGAGPALARFGVPGTLADPILKVIDSTRATIATNDNWSDPTLTNGRTVEPEEVAAAASASGAFEFAAGSKDAALLITLVPGAYTIQLSGVNATTGVALVEAYDVPNN